MIVLKHTLAMVLLLISTQMLAADSAASETSYGNNADAGNTVTINGIDFYYEVYGEGDPMLIIHGNGQSISDMHHQVSYFSDHYRVIVTDSRGHGKSGMGEAPLIYIQMMEDYNALLEHLGVSGVNIFGWSDGGIQSLLLAIHHPDKVGKMAIMGANLRPDQTAVYAWVPELLDPFIAMIDEMIAKEDTTEDWHHLSQLLNILVTQPDIPVESLHTIQSPVLVIAGDKDIIRSSHTLEIFDNLPKAHLAILPGQTHWAPATDPEGFNALLDRFFATPYERPTSQQILASELGAAEE